MFTTKPRRPQYREVIPEDSLDVEGREKRPIMPFRVGKPIFFAEAKKPGVAIKTAAGRRTSCAAMPGAPSCRSRCSPTLKSCLSTTAAHALGKGQASRAHQLYAFEEYPTAGATFGRVFTPGRFGRFV